MTPPPLPDDERVMLLLGLLTSQDRHGYEINDFIEHQLSCVSDLKKATAYQLLDRLEQHRLIESRTEQHGNRPNRKVYALTPQGQAHFVKLLTRLLPEEEPLILPGNVAIMFVEHLSPQEQVRALSERASKLETRVRTLEHLVGLPNLTSGVRLAMGRILALTRTDLDWTRALISGIPE